MTFSELEIDQEFYVPHGALVDYVFSKISDDEGNCIIFGRRTNVRFEPEMPVLPISREKDYPEVKGMYQTLLEEYDCEWNASLT